MRAGGGVINLPRADNPLVFASPVALSFGLVAPTATQTQQVDLTDAGGGAGAWAVSVDAQSAHPSVAVSVPPTVTVPGPLPVTVTTTKAPDAEATGYVVLTRGAEKRRIPYWFRTGAAELANAKTTPLRRAGHVLVDDEGRRGANHELQLPRVALRLRLLDEAARPGARLPPDARPSGRQLRRRRHEPREGRSRRAADRARGRRAPSDRLRRAAVQPEPVPAHLRRAGARGRDDPARRRRVRRRLRQPLGRERRQVRVPLLDQRLDAAYGRPEDEARQARRSAGPDGHGQRGQESTRPRWSSWSTGRSGAAAWRAARFASRPRHSPRDGIRCVSSSPTTRRRGTWRTSARSCRTRASCRRPSSSAEPPDPYP